MTTFITHRALAVALAVLFGATAAAHAQCDSTNRLSGGAFVVSAPASRPHLTPLVLAPYPEVGRPLTWFWTVRDSDLTDFAANEEIQLAVLEPADFTISRKRVRGPLNRESDTFAIGTLALPAIQGPLHIVVVATDHAGNTDTAALEICVSDRTVFDLPIVVTSARNQQRYLHLAFVSTERFLTGRTFDSEFCENELPMIDISSTFDVRWMIPATMGVDRMVQPEITWFDGRPIRSFAAFTAEREEYPITLRYSLNDLHGAPFDLKLWDDNWNFATDTGSFAFNMQTLALQSPGATFATMQSGDSVTLIVMSPTVRGVVIGPSTLDDLGVNDERTGRLPVTVAPTPTAGAARITFTTERPGEARLEIFAANGAHVRTLLDDRADAGMHEVLWDGTDASGCACPSGHYRARVTSAGTTRTASIVLIR